MFYTGRKRKLKQMDSDLDSEDEVYMPPQKKRKVKKKKKKKSMCKNIYKFD